MERIRIDEMRRAFQERTGKRLLKQDVAKKVFKGDGIQDGTARSRLSEWNAGKSLSTLRPSNILAMAKVFGVTDINEMFEA